MPMVFVDFETRSKVDLRKHGLFRYAADESTLPLMLAVGTKSKQRQWNLPLPHQPGNNPSCPDWLVGLIENPAVEFHAHNAGFEIAIWDYICVGRWGWPKIPLDRWHCTAAKAAAANLPRSLDKVTKRLGCKEKKDNTGKMLIRQLSLPTKAQKTDTRIKKDENGKSVKDANGRVVKYKNKLSEQYAQDQGWELFEGDYPGALYFFNEDPALMDAFRKYNVQDIIAEIYAHEHIPAVHPMERKVWSLDREINQRGIPVDLALCKGAIEVYGDELTEAASEIEQLTGGHVTALTQRQKILDWIQARINWPDSLRKEDVEDGLARDDIPDDVRRVLELRQLVGGTAVAKYQATLDVASSDGRARDQLLYYGATTTGRWSGRGLQPHNFKREKTLNEDYINTIKTGNHADVKALAELTGKTVPGILSGCLRGIICAPKGKKLLFSDFAGIESRVLNWLCGNTKKVQLFRDGQDAYIYTALDVYDCRYEDIADWNGKKWKIKPEHSDKRQIGKACELGLGYGMGAKTFQVNAARAGSVLDDEFASEVVSKWRSANPEIPQFWRDIESACFAVVAKKRPKWIRHVNGLEVYLDGLGYLCIKLPSGRSLRYYQPIIAQDKRIFEDQEEQFDAPKLFYLDGGKTGHAANKGRIDTYGGKLTENIVQAISRDLLVNSMFIIAEAGVPIIFHVHDEVVTEIDENDDSSFDIVHRAMETVPSWANGLPLVAETQVSRRFTK